MSANSKKKKKHKVRITAKTKLTPKERAFAEYIIQGHNQTQAYLKAGYQGAKPSSIRSNASDLSAQPNIRSYIDAEQKRMIDNLVLDRYAIQQRLLEIGMGMYHDEVVTNALVDEDESGHKSFKPVVVSKKVAAKESITALSYLDKALADRELNKPSEDEPNDPLTESILGTFGKGEPHAV